MDDGGILGIGGGRRDTSNVGGGSNTVKAPIPGTALMVDLRNFTPNLNAAPLRGDGASEFCDFLAQFYGLCLEACTVSMDEASRAAPPLHVVSTGDGILAVFVGEAHMNSGYLAAIMLHSALPTICRDYNGTITTPGCPETSYGIGLESGAVTEVAAGPIGSGRPAIRTFIGQCINVAARAEAMSKALHNGNTILSGGIVERLCSSLYSESYQSLMDKALVADLDDVARLELHDLMNGLNRRLCLMFIHHHRLKGVVSPVPLFRLADRTAHLSNPRFDALLSDLTFDDGHAAEVRSFIKRWESQGL